MLSACHCSEDASHFIGLLREIADAPRDSEGGQLAADPESAAAASDAKDSRIPVDTDAPPHEEKLSTSQGK